MKTINEFPDYKLDERGNVYAVTKSVWKNKGMWRDYHITYKSNKIVK